MPLSLVCRWRAMPSEGCLPHRELLEKHNLVIFDDFCTAIRLGVTWYSYNRRTPTEKWVPLRFSLHTTSIYKTGNYRFHLLV